MKVINSDLLKQFDTFMTSLKSSDKIAIYHDSDPDGTCAGVIAAKATEALTGKKVALHTGANKNHRFVSEELANEFKKEKINKLIIVDIAAEEKPEGLLIVSKFADILIIDHHKVYHDLKDEKQITLIKPQLIWDMPEPSKYCTSKLVYDLMLRQVKQDSLDWVSVVGLIGDVCTSIWPEFMQAVFTKYNIELKKDLFETKLGLIARIISSAEVYSDKNINLCFNALYKAKNPDDIINSELVKFKDIIEGEIKYFIDNAQALAEFQKDIELVFYLVEPKHAIKSPLCTILGFKYPNQTVIVVTKENENYCVSARRQDKKVAVNNLLEECTKGFNNSNAGGHAVSAGATFPVRYFDEFKSRLVANLKKHRLENRKI